MTRDEAHAIWADRTYEDEGVLDAAVRLSQRYGGLDADEREAIDVLMAEYAEMLPRLAAVSSLVARTLNDVAQHLAMLAKAAR